MISPLRKDTLHNDFRVLREYFFKAIVLREEVFT